MEVKNGVHGTSVQMEIKSLSFVCNMGFSENRIPYSRESSFFVFLMMTA